MKEKILKAKQFHVCETHRLFTFLIFRVSSNVNENENPIIFIEAFEIGLPDNFCRGMEV